MDIRLALMCGSDIPIPECQIVLHQPTIEEISYVGENDFYTGTQCITIRKNSLDKDKTILANASNFQIFMTIMTSKETIDKRNNVIQVFQLFFPKYKISILPRGIYMSTEDGISASIDENNFEYLQNAIRMVCCLNAGLMGQDAFNPADEQARQIAEKLMAGRRKVAAQNNSSNSSILSQYISILTIGLNSMSLTDCMNLTLFQLFDLVERYGLYVDWDIDIRSRLAGGKPDSKPDNWMKNIH